MIVFATLCFRLGHLSLLQPDEGRNAEVGREMKESGAWLVPTYNGVAWRSGGARCAMPPMWQ
jgi:4-amino-4-deoxy-L-arabinose transferase-like glycosyltransferase